ncbi:MAG: arylesterase [Acidiferrobacterales bacterium]|nr:arylesterase [Acidiferrobacterales bacterium]
MTKKLLIIVLFLMAMPIAAAAPKILIVGDSLSAGYGIDLRMGWVALLQKRLKEKGYPYQLVNASISGDTSASALSRLPGSLKRHRPEIVIIEIGGNDGLQGLSAEEMEQNIRSMVVQSKQKGAKVVLLGMRLPPNYGPAYTERFFSVYRRVAEKQGASLVPFFLEGVAGKDGLMQADGIHPTVEAQPTLVENVWPALSGLF